MFNIPARRHAIETEHGDKAIANAALMLRALLAAETSLGVRSHETLFVVLALREWGANDIVTIERHTSMAVNPAEWRVT